MSPSNGTIFDAAPRRLPIGACKVLCGISVCLARRMRFDLTLKKLSPDGLLRSKPVKRRFQASLQSVSQGGQMRIQKFLQEAKKFEVGAYKKLQALTLNHVPFTGAPQKHPYDEDKIILIADPLSTQIFYYEFKTADIEGIEELPSLVTPEGESMTIVRLWVKKGRIGVRCTPFVVEDTTGRRLKVKSADPSTRRRG